jgi:hypothetical protein
MMLCCFGCAGKLQDPERFDFLIKHADAGAKQSADASTSGPPACLTTLFQTKCNTTVGCHGGAAPAAGLDLILPHVEDRLVGKMSSPNSACANMTLVAADGSGGLLTKKLTDTPGCGAPMPFGPGPSALKADELSCVKDWVASVDGS